MFSGFDLTPALLAAAWVGVSGSHPAAFDPFAAWYTAPLPEQPVDWSAWRPLFARGTSSGGTGRQ
jgi:hypothetical protein